MINYNSFLLTFISGFSTLFGLIFLFINEKYSNKIISMSLAFSSGVMLCITVIELIPESLKYLNLFLTILFIFISIIFSFIIDKSLSKINKNLYRVGIMSLIVITLHNIPEGMLTYLTNSIDGKLGLSITIAIALHNIPEGIAIAVPIYYSTNSLKKAFLYVIVSALSEPFGAFIAYLFNFDINYIYYLFPIISGIMLYISLFDLLSESKTYTKKAYIYLLIGFLFMLVNLIILN